MKYHLLSSVTLTHEYYDLNPCKELDISLSSGTQRRLESEQLMAKIAPGNMKVIARENATLQQSLVVNVFLSAKNSDFYYFTDLQTFEKANCKPFILVDPEKNESVNLNEGNSQIVLVRSVGELQMECATLQGDEVQISNESGEVLFKGVVSDIQHSLTLADLEENEMLLIESDEEFKRMFYTSEKPFGILGVVSVKVKIQFDSQFNLNIEFNSKKAIWKYFLISRQKRALDNFVLQNNNTKEELSAIEDKVLFNGQSAKVVSTVAAFPLKKRYANKFELSWEESLTSGLPGGKRRKIGMPHPAVKNVKSRLAENAIAHTAEMYVYV